MKIHSKASTRPSDLRAHAGFWLRFVSNSVSQAFARKLLACGVTVAEWVILRVMFDAGSTSPGALVKATGLTKGTVSKLVERLVQKKLVRREEGKLDRRTQTIALTAAGCRLVPQLAAIADENDEAFFSILTAQQREDLIETCQRLVEANHLNQLPTE